MEGIRLVFVFFSTQPHISVCQFAGKSSFRLRLTEFYLPLSFRLEVGDFSRELCKKLKWRASSLKRRKGCCLQRKTPWPAKRGIGGCLREMYEKTYKCYFCFLMLKMMLHQKRHVHVPFHVKRPEMFCLTLASRKSPCSSAIA